MTNQCRIPNDALPVEVNRIGHLAFDIHSSFVIRHSSFSCLLLIFAFSLITASAETVYLAPTADTTLLEAFPTNNFGGNEYFNSGTTQNFTTNRALLKFDLLSALPTNAKITSATLTVEVVGNPVAGDLPSSFGLHRVLRDWGEGNKAGHPPQQPGLGQAATAGEATFLHRFAFTTNTWATPAGAAGIDYDHEMSADTFVYDEFFSPYTFDSTPRLVADLQYWLAYPESNFGWMLICRAEANDFTARRFASREDPFRAPILAVDYFVPRIERIIYVDGEAHIHFSAQPGYAYAVESCDLISSSEWSVLTNIPPQTMATEIIVEDDRLLSAHKFYRLVVR